MSTTIEALIHEVRRKAEEEAERILAEAREKADRIIREAQEKAKQIPAARLREVEKKLAEKEKMKLAEARIEGRRMMLRARMEMIDRAVEEAVKRVRSYVDGNPGYRAVLKRLALEGVLALEADRVVLMCNQRDRGLLEGMVEELVEEVRSRFGREVSIEVSPDTVDIIGGVIAATADGKRYYNSSIDARITTFKDEVVSELEEILFGEE